MNVNKRYPREIASYHNGRKGLILYNMPNGTLLIQVYNLATRWIIETYNTKAHNLDEIGIAARYEEIKSKLMAEVEAKASDKPK